jgi:transcription initiation factor TFIIE subunit alpha
MKLSNKAVEDVIAQVAGEDVLPLVQALKNKKNVSEFKLAERIRQEINITRNMLYRLYHANLVTFTRKKDKAKGWYIYYWTFKPKHIKYLAEDLKKQRLEKLRERVGRERDGSFFMCQSKCMRLNFEQAVDFFYKCPECGQLMHQEDNTATIERLEDDIEKLEHELSTR